MSSTNDNTLEFWVQRDPLPDGYHWFGNPPEASLGSNKPVEAQRIPVNKTTHRIRFENETESEVTVVIEPK